MLRSLALVAFAAALIGAGQEPPLPVDDLPASLDGEVPLGLPEAIPDPEGNAYSAERVALGRRLFFDPVLSANGTVACASCHDPKHGFAGTTPTSLGIDGQTTERNTPDPAQPGLRRALHVGRPFRDAREQVLEPIANPREMGTSVDEVLERLRDDAEYAAMFGAAYEGGVTRDNLARALAVFLRRLVLGDSPVDRFRVGGDHGALTEEERTGLWIYESKGRCWRCHNGPNFTDEAFHNTGVGAADGVARPGRFAVTGDEADRGAFKTPTLRGLAQTAPYMHDGSVATLREVVDFYRRGGVANEHLDPMVTPVELNEREAEALVAFLEALSVVAE